MNGHAAQFSRFIIGCVRGNCGGILYPLPTAPRLSRAIFCLLLTSPWLRAGPDERAVSASVPSYEVRRASGNITIDGRIDEAAWQDATPLTLQFPWDAQTGAKQKTTARLLWDNDYLYVCFDCKDTDITAHHEHRDEPTYEDDAVEIFINPRPTLDVYVGLEMNAKGTLCDFVYVFPHMLLKNFDLQGVKIATHLDGSLNGGAGQAEGWQLELAIPLKNFDDFTRGALIENGTIWTFNLSRWDGTEPHRRLSVWSDSGMAQPDPHNPKRFGRLVFVK